ncbi:helix-turn-helix domain-containing protein [Rhodococcus rhodnii]|nr:helix-turn-helix transcriptional regulator [Rhodococcus rhodnii]
MPREAWGTFVRGQLEAKGMSPNQLALALGLRPRHVIDWIDGASGFTVQPATVVHATARALGVPTNDALVAAGYPAR